MMFKKMIHPRKQQSPVKRTEQELPRRSLTPEERSQFLMEMSMGSGLMSPGSFPDGIWHLY